MRMILKKPWIQKILTQPRILLLLYILIVIVVSLQSFLLADKIIEAKAYTQYNNYVIFKQSFHHLTEGKDLYQLYPNEQWDLYKYSPTFSLLFGMFAGLPDIVGLYLWNLINATLLFLAIRLIPGMSNKNKNAILIFIIAELITSLQNSQSNGLLAGLIILSFGLLEGGKYLLATLCIVLTIYIKIFGIVAFALFIFYPQKWKLLLYSILWLFILFLLPLVTITFHQLTFLYKSWYVLLLNDHSVSDGLSVMRCLKILFNFDISKNIILITGITLFCIPFIRTKEYIHYQFRLLTLSALLLWIIIFNHRAESPTFIIAISGIAIWYFVQAENKINTIFLIGAFVFTSLSVSDLVPSIIRENFVYPYAIKVIPCILIWIKITGELMFQTFTFTPELQRNVLNVAY